jgi:p-cumate 2,3-dioxygenase ferredoxin subunit
MAMHALCRTDELAPGEIAGRSLPDGSKVAIYNVDNTYYVTSDVCTHGESSLSEEGLLDGHLVECGWHMGTFDVRTGAPTGRPCVVPIKSYPVTVIDGQVHIEVG